jgi:hypothetical protein
MAQRPKLCGCSALQKSLSGVWWMWDAELDR